MGDVELSDYLEAIADAEAQGDAKALNELLVEAEKKWPSFGREAAPVDRDAISVGDVSVKQSSVNSAMNDLGVVAERIGSLSMDGSLEGGYEKRLEREQTLTGGRHIAPRSENIVTAATGISESIRRGGQIVMSGIATVTPDAVKDEMKEAWAKVKDKPIMQTAANKVLDGFEAYKAWSDENPRGAEAFETFVDISAMLSPKPQPNLSRASKKASRLSRSVSAQEKRRLVDKAMDPRVTREAGYEGEWIDQDDILDSFKYEPTQREQAVRQALSSVEELDPTSNYVKMENVTSKAIADQGKEVVAYIQRAGNPKLNKKATRQFLETHFLDTSDAYGALNLTKEAQSKVKEYTDLALKIIDESDYSALGLYEARKRFDYVVNQFPTKDILDSTVESAKGVAANHVRGVINDVIKAATPGDKVADSFDRMHHLFRARDHLRMRSAGLADNSIKRAWHTFSDALNMPKTPLALAATLGGAGTVAALVSLTPAAIVSGAGAGLSVYAVVKALSKPNRVKFYAAMVSAADKGIKTYAGEKNLLRELKADRAVLLSLLEDARSERED